jgi:hypothetical protein
MSPEVKTWIVTVECGTINRVLVYAPNKRLAVWNYRQQTGDYRGCILSVRVKKPSKPLHMRVEDSYCKWV